MTSDTVTEALIMTAQRMRYRHSYWLCLYNCGTLQYWSIRAKDYPGQIFWKAVYAYIKVMEGELR